VTFIVVFLKNGKHLSNTSHYFGKSAVVFSMNVNGKSYSERVQYIAEGSNISRKCPIYRGAQCRLRVCAADLFRYIYDRVTNIRYLSI